MKRIELVGGPANDRIYAVPEYEECFDIAESPRLIDLVLGLGEINNIKIHRYNRTDAMNPETGAVLYIWDNNYGR